MENYKYFLEKNKRSDLNSLFWIFFHFTFVFSPVFIKATNIIKTPVIFVDIKHALKIPINKGATNLKYFKFIFSSTPFFIRLLARGKIAFYEKNNNEYKNFFIVDILKKRFILIKEE